MDEKTVATRYGIECMTLWLEGDDPQQRARNAVHLARLASDVDERNRMIPGLLNLALIVLVDLMSERGAVSEELVPRAREYLQRLATGLPE